MWGRNILGHTSQANDEGGERRELGTDCMLMDVKSDTKGHSTGMRAPILVQTDANRMQCVWGGAVASNCNAYYAAKHVRMDV